MSFISALPFTWSLRYVSKFCFGQRPKHILISVVVLILFYFVLYFNEVSRVGRKQCVPQSTIFKERVQLSSQCCCVSFFFFFSFLVLGQPPFSFLTFPCHTWQRKQKPSDRSPCFTSSLTVCEPPLLLPILTSFPFLPEKKVSLSPCPPLTLRSCPPHCHTSSLNLIHTWRS